MAIIEDIGSGMDITAGIPKQNSRGRVDIFILALLEDVLHLQRSYSVIAGHSALCLLEAQLSYLGICRR
jgi:hypothetical protein